MNDWYFFHGMVTMALIITNAVMILLTLQLRQQVSQAFPAKEIK